ncbi:MAG: helix-turn-helix domain-containing protein [Candidatus Kapabacteria bacterium]|nr:helix-turn-helix domain-containing protein [Candidatus Kapabacteria bacterium]
MTNTLHTEKEMLSFKEFLTYTGYSKHQAYKLTSTGRIKHFKPTGKVIFFKKSDVDEFLQTNPKGVK